MSCQNPFGQSNCQIVQHPDRQHESFCVNCHKRFRNDYGSFEAWHFLLAIVLSLFMFRVFLSEQPELIEPAKSEPAAVSLSNYENCSNLSCD